MYQVEHRLAWDENTGNLLCHWWLKGGIWKNSWSLEPNAWGWVSLVSKDPHCISIMPIRQSHDLDFQSQPNSVIPAYKQNKRADVKAKESLVCLL